MIEAIATGATVEEALAAVKEQLNAPEDADVQFEVLTQGSKKILGLFGGSPAKVRAYYEEKSSKGKKHNDKREKNKPRKSEKPVREDKKPVQKQAKPQKEEKTYTAADTNTPAVVYLKNILDNMGINATLDAKEADGELYIDITGDGVGTVIGHHGETLDALQYLVSLAANRKEKVYSRVTLDSAGYREKRAEALISLAGNIAARSIRDKKNIALEPMNPYERRIIHTAVQSIEGVKSWSMGEEPSRRVVIGNDGFESVRSGHGRRNDRRGGRRPAKPAYQPDASKLREKKTEHDDIALYGKIN